MNKITTFVANSAFLKKLYGYIIKSYIGTFVFTFFVALFILLMQFVWCYFDEFVGKGLGFDVMAKLLFYMAVTFVPTALPLAILLSSLMCFGNLGEYYEIVAMKASGISTWKTMRPLFVFSIVMSLVAFVFSNDVLPVATLKAKTLLHDVRKQKMAFSIPEGVFYRGIDDYVIKVEEKDPDGVTLYDVMIYDHTDHRGNIKITTAKWGTMELTPNQLAIIFTLYDGYNYSESINDDNYSTNRGFERMYFGKQYFVFDMTEFVMSFSDEESFKGHYSMLNIKQLDYALDSLYIKAENDMETYRSNFRNRFRNLNGTAANDRFVKNKNIRVDTVTSLQWPLLYNFKKQEQNGALDIAISSSGSMRDNAMLNADDLNRQQLNIRKHQQVYHQKFALSIACLLFFFIGAPLGAIIRKGGLGLPVVISVVFFVIYYVMTMTGERIALSGDMPMFVACWLSFIVLFPIGVFLTFKATTDAALLDGESWRKMFSKIFHKSK